MGLLSEGEDRGVPSREVQCTDSVPGVGLEIKSLLYFSEVCRGGTTVREERILIPKVFFMIYVSL